MTQNMQSKSRQSEYNDLSQFVSGLYSHGQVEKLDLFAILRYFDAKNKSSRIGYARTPREDKLRLGQNPSTIFAPSAIYSIEKKESVDQPLIKILSFGVFGPNGALPIHLTEYVYERLHHYGDSSASDFVDIFHHRLISLFYRAWADARPVVQMDRPGVDKFSLYVGSLIGMGFDASWNRDSIEDSAKIAGAGHLVRLTRNPEGLEKLISAYFQIPAKVMEFQKKWVTLEKEDQSCLSKDKKNNQLGLNLVAGSRVLDVQGQFKICLGPMKLDVFKSFFPNQIGNIKIKDWIRNYIGLEFAWDLQLLLDADEVPPFQLGRSCSALGQTSWLGQRKSLLPADEYILNPEKDSVRFPL